MAGGGDVVVGKHVYGSLYGVKRELLDDEQLLRGLVAEAAREAGMKLVEVKSWKFGGRRGGVSVIALIVESHIALHTWVEYGYATLDVYTCGENSDPWRAFNHIVRALKPLRHTAHYIDRSSEPGH